MDDRNIDLTNVRLKQLFFRHPQHVALAEQFDLLLRRRRLELDLGLKREVSGILLIGDTGSGKSESVSHMLTRYPDLVLGQPGRMKAEFIKVRLRGGQGGLKGAGYTALRRLGTKLRGDKPSWVIWDMVRDELRDRETLFLHIDEAQHIASVQTPLARQAVIDTFKSLMQDEEWPVGLILSGMPSFKKLVNADPQLARRLYPIEFGPMSPIADGEMISDIVSTYAAKGGVHCGPDLARRDFRPRLVHAGARQFGVIVLRVIHAIDEALRGGDTVLGWQHFVREFRRKTGCIDGLNPFVVDDYLAIDTRLLLGLDEAPL